MKPGRLSIVVILTLLISCRPGYTGTRTESPSGDRERVTGSYTGRDSAFGENDNEDDETVIEEPDSGPDPAFDEAEPPLDERPADIENDASGVSGTGAERSVH